MVASIQTVTYYLGNRRRGQALTPQEFISKWAANERTERAASQSHFNDLCELIGHPKPLDVDSDGTEFTFEKGATTLRGGDGFADVWKKDCFAWEYKGRQSDLIAAYAQLKRYADALNNPPLLIVSDMRTIVIHTAFTNAVKQTHEIRLHELTDPGKRELLRWAFTEPERFRPGRTRRMVTEQAADKFTRLAHSLQKRGYDPQAVAHFLDRLVFCMFAEDVELLPGNIFTQIIHGCVERPEGFVPRISQLFQAMVGGGDLVIVNIPCFNGGLFNDATALPLEPAEIRILSESADLDWSSIDPTIFGTLFERGLDPGKRSQLGAQYTDPDTIMRIVRPVVTEPLTREWEAERNAIAEALPKRGGQAKARKKLTEFLHRLSEFRVLDPACGSGNFLYLALRELKDLERRVVVEAEAMGLHPELLIGVGPEAVKGIEINPYAAELARVAIWIGELQWRVENGYQRPPEPILKPLDQVECRDAILNDDGTEPDWPRADAIVGNPPFLGAQSMLGALGESYVGRLRAAYRGSVSAGADLCSFWLHKARKAIVNEQSSVAGLVATSTIRHGKNRELLDSMLRDVIFTEAWSDEPWINEGASVRVSILCFARNAETVPILDGVPVNAIRADLTAANAPNSFDATAVIPLVENKGHCFQGPVLVGEFDVDGNQARAWLIAPANVNGRPNADVLRPLINGRDIVRRARDRWVIDFASRSESEAAYFEAPFAHVVEHVKSARMTNKDRSRRENWWLHGRTGDDFRRATARLEAYLATPRVSKHRLFVRLPAIAFPDTRLTLIARDDWTTLGILQSKVHELWSLATCSWHGVGNDPTYNTESCFETFPFPDGLTMKLPASRCAADPRAGRIAAAAKHLYELRDNWLNPPDSVDRVPEVVPGYPDRLIPKNEEAARELKRRTLTNLYNANPTWLQHAHRDLDEAVAAAYGWEWPLVEDEVLSRLYALNQERAAAEREEARER